MMAFIKNWTLPIAMIAGALGYFAYTAIPLFDHTHAMALKTVSIVQPLLLFAMLFLTFCRVRPSDLRLSRWQIWLLMFQLLMFLSATVAIIIMPESHWQIVLESAMLCFICPTATAAAVVTRKLGGNVGTLMAYTIIINLAVAIAVPLIVPITHPHHGTTFFKAFLTIISKVFPLLLGPFFLSILVRWLMPKATEWLATARDLPFYMWAFSLSLAIAMSVRSIVHTDCPWTYQIAIAAVSLVACIMQFVLGRKIGLHYGDKITAGQACGQKNTVLVIWMGYTFMTPITSIAGGFYSVWHNLWNSYQLLKVRRGYKK